jgi:[acyl-carrier-protein] S-malonyltransferase
MTDALLFPGLTPAKHRRVERFLRRYPGARSRFDECSDVLGYDLEERYQTADIYDWETYEVAFLAINLAVVDWTREETGVDPAVVCGQSFGGYCAVVAAGSLALADMVSLLSRSARAEHAYFSALQQQLACVFFSRIGDTDVDDLIARATREGGWAELSVQHDHGIYAVSGTAEAIGRLETEVRARRGLVYYTVNRAEHCPRMHPVRALVEREVYAGLPFAAPGKVFVSDVTGGVVATGAGIRSDLLDGWTHPTVAHVLYDGLERLGVDRLVIPGPRGAFRGHGMGRFEIVGVSPADVSEAVR